MAGLYIHIPFCKKACHYCDFHFSTSQHNMLELCEAIALEITLQKDYLGGEQLNTIYFGGGTPSLLPYSELNNILSLIRQNYHVSQNAEITLEANPDDLTNEKLKELKYLGINRLSIGIQTFDENLLKFLNRSHTSQDTHYCLERVKRYGFNNINIDLMYAIPGLSSKLWEETLLEAVDYSPNHISAYALTIEEKTVFGNWSKKGKLISLNEEVTSEQMEILMSVLDSCGYNQYEISNFCKPNYYAKHNSNYWNKSKYLGIGPSAHSYDGNSRQFNVRNNPLYIKSLKTNTIPFEREILTRENKINEHILTTLRTSWGCDLNFLKQILGDDTYKRCKTFIDNSIQNKLLNLKRNTLFLTKKGKLLADKITDELMIIH